jgi:hypothetical protein
MGPRAWWPVLFLCVITSGTVAEKQTRSGPYDPGHLLLRTIKSPQQLLFPHFAKRYCVPVTLSGPIADEMGKAITDAGLEQPGYRESFDGKRFSLFLSNENYPLYTRDLLSGILNPPEMIDMAVSSIPLR